MEQFSLEKYFENPNCKVVTRGGKPVTIVCSKSPYDTIVGFCGEDQYPDLWDLNGKFLKDRDSDYDLFFADEGDGLTEFEEAVKSKLSDDYSTHDAKIIAKELFDLARKKIEKEEWRAPLRVYKNGYNQGKQDSLKDLPKWSKRVGGSTCPFLDYDSKGEDYLHLNDYMIKVSELFEKLPKEE